MEVKPHGITRLRCGGCFKHNSHGTVLAWGCLTGQRKTAVGGRGSVCSLAGRGAIHVSWGPETAQVPAERTSVSGRLLVPFADGQRSSSRPQPCPVLPTRASRRFSPAKAPAPCGKAASGTRRRSSPKALPGIFGFVWLGFVFQEPQTSWAASVCGRCLTNRGSSRGGRGGGSATVAGWGVTTQPLCSPGAAQLRSRVGKLSVLQRPAGLGMGLAVCCLHSARILSCLSQAYTTQKRV